MNNLELKTNELFSSQKKRPFVVWVIFISYILSTASTISSYMFFWSGKIQQVPELGVIANSMTVVDYGFSFIMGVLNMIGAWMLFNLKRNSYNIFLSVFGICLLSIVYQAFIKSHSAGLGMIGLYGEMFSCMTAVFIVFYIRKLIKKDVIK